jgi:hypothetical protein
LKSLGFVKGPLGLDMQCLCHVPNILSILV